MERKYKEMKNGQKGERRRDEGRERGKEVGWSSDCGQCPSTERHTFSGLPGQARESELREEHFLLRRWA